jgi:CubicO group peptidase (beta-lactamase class C family)
MRPITLICLSLVLSISCSITQKSTSYDNTITNIENHLYTISASGKDTGTAQTVSQRMAALGIKGMSVAVFDERKIIWNRCYGLRNEHEGIDSATVFQAASIRELKNHIQVAVLQSCNYLLKRSQINPSPVPWKS